MKYNISDKVLVCNDSALLFEEAFWHHTMNNKDIAIVSNDFRKLNTLAVEYAEKHYPGEYRWIASQRILETPHGKIYFVSHERMKATGLCIHRGFMLQDREDKTHIKQLINKILIRCRIR